MNEKRIYQRHEYAQPVHFRSTDLGQAGGCLSKDLSEGGVRVRLNEFVTVGSELALSIKLTSGNYVECIGRVIWVERARFGDYYIAGVKFEENDTIFGSRNMIHRSLSLQDHLSSPSVDQFGA